MRFIFDTGGWNPTDGAIIPKLLEKGAESAQETATDVILHLTHDGGIWFMQNGLPLAAEMVLIWGMACLLIGCTGSGVWVERGVKAMLISVMLGVAKYAI